MRAVFRKRVVVVGDEGVGKTSLILTRLQGAVAAGGATASISGSPDHPGSHRREGSMDGSGAIRSRHRDVADEIESNPLYRMPPAPTVLEDQYDSVDLLGYTLVDTSGSHSLDRLRPYSYEGATGFLVCFSVGDPASLQEVTEKWVPEIKYFAPGVPFSLLACKVDLREDPDALAALKSENLTPISAEEGEEIALKVGASRYVETSIILNVGIEEAFVDPNQPEDTVQPEAPVGPRRRHSSSSVHGASSGSLSKASTAGQTKRRSQLTGAQRSSNSRPPSPPSIPARSAASTGSRTSRSSTAGSSPSSSAASPVTSPQRPKSPAKPDSSTMRRRATSAGLSSSTSSPPSSIGSSALAEKANTASPLSSGGSSSTILVPSPHTPSKQPHTSPPAGRPRAISSSVAATSSTSQPSSIAQSTPSSSTPQRARKPSSIQTSPPSGPSSTSSNHVVSSPTTVPSTGGNQSTSNGGAHEPFWKRLSASKEKPNPVSRPIEPRRRASGFK